MTRHRPGRDRELSQPLQRRVDSASVASHRASIRRGRTVDASLDVDAEPWPCQELARRADDLVGSGSGRRRRYSVGPRRRRRADSGARRRRLLDRRTGCSSGRGPAAATVVWSRRGLVAFGVGEVERPEEAGQVLAVDRARRASGGSGGGGRSSSATGRPADRSVEPARDGEQRVAHRLEVEPAAVHPPEERVLRVDRAAPRAGRRSPADRRSRA